MDVGKVLRAARGQARVSQAGLAVRAGTSRAIVSAYETGTKSPTVRSLNRLLAACDLMARVSLVPLLADVDARVDALTSGPPTFDLGQDAQDLVSEMDRLALGLDADPAHVPMNMWIRTRERTAVPWAFDGATALALHGFTPESDVSSIVIAWGDAARHWLEVVGARAMLGRTFVSDWFEIEFEDARAALRHEPVLCEGAYLTVRVVTELPAVIRVQPPGAQRVFPVIGIDAVAEAFEEHREVLERWRQRVAAGRNGPTLGA